MPVRRSQRNTTVQLSWEEQRRLESQRFIEGWDWKRAFRDWTERIADFAVAVSPFFTEVYVHDPQNPVGREPCLSWWPTREIRELHEKLQRHLIEHPGTIGPLHPPTYYQRKGELETLDYLWRLRQDAEDVAAVLVAASLFSRLRSSRGRYPNDNWPPFHCSEALETIAYTQLQGKISFPGWQDTCTQVIPVVSSDHDYNIKSLGSLIRYLAEEHSALLCTYRPVVICFSNKSDPFLDRVISEKQAAEKKKHEEWQQQRKVEQDRKQEETRRLKERHPRWGEWHQISEKELRRLVWTMPTTKIAENFGVSDVAIGKRCKSLGINKPPPGFWAKVDAGVIPHPNGQPPRD